MLCMTVPTGVTFCGRHGNGSVRIVGRPGLITDVLAQVAGAIISKRTETAQGLEATWASMVVGPFLLTELLRRPLSLRSLDG